MTNSYVLILHFGKELNLKESDKVVIDRHIPDFDDVDCFIFGRDDMPETFHIDSYETSKVDLVLSLLLALRRESENGNLVFEPLSSFDEITYLIVYFDDDVDRCWLSCENFASQLPVCFVGGVKFTKDGVFRTEYLPPTSQTILDQGWLVGRL